MKCLRKFRVVVLLALLSVVSGLAATGASAQVAARIKGAIDSTSRAAVPGNVSPRARIATDLGEASGDTALQSMTLRFSMTDAQQTALNALLVAQQTPGSGQYHQWLTPEQFASQFGLSSTDLAKVSTWLAGQGFKVTQVARGGQFIRFSGTVAQANAAFGVKMHNVSLNGEAHIANLDEPTLPAAIASVTVAVTGLNDFRAKPHMVHRRVLATGDEGLVKPNFTSSLSGSIYIVPADFYTIYDENPLLSSGINGTGVKVAVVGQTDVILGDISTFRAAAGLGANAPTVMLYGTDPGTPLTGGVAEDQLESELDLEWLGSTAPSASIIFVNSTDVLDTSLVQAIDNNLAPIIADSYGNCEANLGSAFLTAQNAVYMQGAAQGITLTAAAGDTGSTDCEASTATIASHGLSVDFPASSPYVTGLGGTEFNEGSGTYWATTNASNGGSALSYIPEKVWNDDAAVGGLSAGGGGVSAFFTKPTWQTGTGVPNDGQRDVPDVSLDASASHDGYLICTSGYCTNGFRDPNGYLDVVGGTSVASPSFAGLLALVEQKTGQRIGVANQAIYQQLANGQYAANIFHDITVGNNESPCVTGSLNCTGGLSTGYVATAGYDQATGWGSVDATNLITYWAMLTPSSVGTTKSVTTLAGTPSSVVAGTTAPPVALTATVASGSTSVTATPTGSIQFAVDDVSVGTAVSLSAGVATYSLTTTSLAAGTHMVLATYSGDANYAASTGSFTLTVQSSTTTPDFSLTPTTASVTTKAGSVASGITFTATSLNGFTGAVTFTASAASTLNASATFTPTTVTLASGGTGSTVFTLYAYTTNARSGGTLSQLRAPERTRLKGAASRWYEAGGGVALAGLLCLVLPRRRKLSALLLIVLSIGAIGLSGCGGGSGTSGSTTTTTNTTAGTYTITISATGLVNGVNTTHSSTVTWTVD
jgi:subtilase family serine protease